MSKETLLQQVTAAPKRRGHVNFFDRQSPKIQAELLELRRAYLAGKCGGRSVREVYEVVRGALNPTVGVQGFYYWLRTKEA